MNKSGVAALVFAGSVTILALAGWGNRTIRGSITDSFHAVQDGIVDGRTAALDLIGDSWRALRTRFSPETKAAVS